MRVWKKVGMIVSGVMGFSLSCHAEPKAAPEVASPVVPAPPASPVTYTGLYVEGNAGYTWRDWVTAAGSPFTGSTVRNVSNGTGAFIYGFDLGYQVIRFVSIEGGWFQNMHVEGDNGNFVNATSAHINTWFAYGGLKLSFPLFLQCYVFGKIFGFYETNQASAAAVSTNGQGSTQHTNYWMVGGAGGLQYYFTRNFSINTQYMIIPRYHESNSTSFGVPAANILMGGLGYKFML